MVHEMQNDMMTIFLEERIDTNNAASTEQEISEILKDKSFKKLIFQAEKLAYISSAGLRVLVNYPRPKGHGLVTAQS